MAVYYKFKSAKKYDSITIADHFITVLNLKQRIFESKHMMRRGTDLIVTNAQTNEEYVDELMLIPKNTSVSVRRVPGPGPLPMPIVIPLAKPKVDDHLAESSSVTADSSMSNNSEPLDYYDDFGDDIYVTTPQVTARESSILMKDSTSLSKADEDSKIKALTESSGLDWQRQASNGLVQRMSTVSGGRTFGQGCGLQQKTPPQGYICHRCKIPGHYIQHCPTNGDPNFDIRKVKPPTGLPKSMLVPTPDGLYALANGTSVAFEKQIASQSSTRSIVNLPPELNCPLCNQVMKDAVFTSKCCYRSFCDKCIRDCIISKSMCYCRAENIVADDLLPNTTVRDTINRILESGNSRSTITDNGGSSIHVQDMESAQSDVSNVDQSTPSQVEELNVKEYVLQQRPQDDYMGRFSGNMPCNMGYHLVPQNSGYPPPLIPSHPPWSQRDVAAKFSDHCHHERERSRERYSVERDQDSDRERRRKSIHRQSDRDHGHYHRRIKC